MAISGIEARAGSEEGGANGCCYGAVGSETAPIVATPALTVPSAFAVA